MIELTTLDSDNHVTTMYVSALHIVSLHESNSLLDAYKTEVRLSTGAVYWCKENVLDIRMHIQGWLPATGGQ